MFFFCFFSLYIFISRSQIVIFVLSVMLDLTDKFIFVVVVIALVNVMCTSTHERIFSGTKINRCNRWSDVTQFIQRTYIRVLYRKRIVAFNLCITHIAYIRFYCFRNQNFFFLSLFTVWCSIVCLTIFKMCACVFIFILYLVYLFDLNTIFNIESSVFTITISNNKFKVKRDYNSYSVDVCMHWFVYSFLFRNDMRAEKWFQQQNTK